MGSYNSSSSSSSSSSSTTSTTTTTTTSSSSSSSSFKEFDQNTAPASATPFALRHGRRQPGCNSNHDMDTC
nr:unnamed protein product [Spirometra erinaceieuropaei]